MYTWHVVGRWQTQYLYAVTTDLHWVVAEYTRKRNGNAEFDKLIAPPDFHILKFFFIISIILIHAFKTNTF